jgi:hypothetical protein
MLIKRRMSPILRYLNPWKFRRQQREQRLAALRSRDGDNCTRCRRPIRFELPPGHDLGARLEQVLPASAGGSDAIDNFCLTHGRCNVAGQDHTEEVMKRLRPQREAELFVKARKKRKAA